MQRALIAAIAVVPLLLGSGAHAQIAVSANDNKVVLENGLVRVQENPTPDTISIIDLRTTPPRVTGEAHAFASVTGPPFSVAITPDESLALVTASYRIDPVDRSRQIPSNQVAVIDLKASPPRGLAVLEAGRGAGGVAINRQGSLALVSNMIDGTVSIFSIQGKTVAAAGTLPVGGVRTGGGTVVFTPDGKHALVSRGDNRVSLLTVAGTKVEYAKRDIAVGLRPLALDVAPNGTFAVVGTRSGGSTGGSDSVALIDLTADPPRVVDVIGVRGASAESLKVSPDSSVVAVVVIDGSNRAKDSPFYRDAGKLVMIRVTGTTLARVAEAPIGPWPQGVAFSPDGKSILVGNTTEKSYWVLNWDGTALHDTTQRVKVSGTPAAIRTADR
jgi:DNA-binding beta-propeller fold protein YncE